MILQWKWLRGQLESEAEQRTFASVTANIDGQIATRLYDRVTAAERESVNVSLYPLAIALAKNWWTLLHEPRKSDDRRGIAEIRHSLDAYMNGFSFPALTIWSGGKEVVYIEHPNVNSNYSNIEFLPTRDLVSTVDRRMVEEDLFQLVRAVIERIPGTIVAELEEPWSRVLESLQNEDERQYCEAAGRLGIDPYDADVDDISKFSEGLSDDLFSTICEAAIPLELPKSAEWAREGIRKISEFPEINIHQFGIFPERDFKQRVWVHGYEAARLVRMSMGVDVHNPKRAIDRIFGAAVGANAKAMEGKPPSALEAITSRCKGSMRVAIPKISARQRRSRLCRASYIAWKMSEGGASAVTTATTLDQQASRAFAAELLAPAELLRERAGDYGLTPEKIENIAEEYICPEQTILWQAHNHDIPLRGVALPRPD